MHTNWILTASGTGAALGTADAAGAVAWDLLGAVLLWGLLTSALMRWLLRRERRAEGATAAGRPQPTVRARKPRRPTAVSTAVDSTSATRTTPTGIVGMLGVSVARSPSLT